MHTPFPTQLKPGIVECLTLQSQDKFLLMTSPDDASTPPSVPRSIFLIQSEEMENSSLNFQTDSMKNKSNKQSSSDHQTETRSNDSSPNNRILNLSEYEGNNPSEPLLWMDNSEAFAYTSLDDSAESALCLSSAQQAFFTNNGIPVILDNAEDDTKISLQEQAGIPLSMFARLKSANAFGDSLQGNIHNEPFFGGELLFMLRVTS